MRVAEMLPMAVGIGALLRFSLRSRYCHKSRHISLAELAAQNNLSLISATLIFSVVVVSIRDKDACW